MKAAAIGDYDAMMRWLDIAAARVRTLDRIRGN
jgi:hypothetical protein